MPGLSIIAAWVLGLCSHGLGSCWVLCVVLWWGCRWTSCGHVGEAGRSLSGVSSWKTSCSWKRRDVRMQAARAGSDLRQCHLRRVACSPEEGPSPGHEHMDGIRATTPGKIDRNRKG